MDISIRCIRDGCCFPPLELPAATACWVPTTGMARPCTAVGQDLPVPCKMQNQTPGQEQERWKHFPGWVLSNGVSQPLWFLNLYENTARGWQALLGRSTHAQDIEHPL